MKTSRPEGQISRTWSAIRFSLGLLAPEDRKRFKLVVAIQMFSSTLDLIGVLLLGLVGVLAGVSVGGNQSPEWVQTVQGLFGGMPVENLAAVAALAATAVFLFKSFANGFLLRHAYRTLARGQAGVSRRMSRQILSVPLFAMQKGTSHEVAWTMSIGLYLTIGGLLGAFALILSETALLVFLLGAMLLVAPGMTLALVLYFAVFAIALHRLLGRWGYRIERDISGSFLRGQQSIQEALHLFPEILVGGRRSFYQQRIDSNLTKNAFAMADQNFVAQLPKLVYEAALVLGMIGVAAFQLATADLASAVTVLTVFLAAGARLMPALIRLQNGIVAVRARSANTDRVRPVVELLDEIAPMEDAAYTHERGDAPAAERGVIRLEEVSHRYPSATRPSLANITLTVVPGEVVAVVGRTGAGKTSLLNVLLGVHEPESGRVSLSGLSPRELATEYPGSVAYVPQSITLIHGTIRENVALGLPKDTVDDSRVWAALKSAHLADFLNQERDGLDTPVGEHGAQLSGGQRQRLGIARALYTRPSILILDEATSALDDHTEALVTDTLLTLRGEVTIVAVAHREATMRVADRVIHMQGGRIDCIGTFEEVMRERPQVRREIDTLDLRPESEVPAQSES